MINNNSNVKETEKKMKMGKGKKKVIGALICIIILLGCTVFGIYNYLFNGPAQTIKVINLPQGSETIHPARFIISDVYEEKILGEKVIKSSLPYEATVEYIESHNSAEQLENIYFVPYGGMSDDYIYDSEEDSSFTKEEQIYYVKITYKRKL